MARYIMIDNYTGYIWGDAVAETPQDAARKIDEALGEYDRDYSELRIDPRDTSTGYHVYRADVDGAQVPSQIDDGQDGDTIDAVRNSCRYEGYIRVTSADAHA